VSTSPDVTLVTLVVVVVVVVVVDACGARAHATPSATMPRIVALRMIGPPPASRAVEARIDPASLCSRLRPVIVEGVWPFGKGVNTVAKLTGIAEPTAVDIVATIASPDQVASPISGLHGAALRIEVFERHELDFREHREVVIASRGDFVERKFESALGVAVLGDSLLLVSEDALHVSVSLRRCTIRSPIEPRIEPLRELPRELVPLFRQPDGSGRLWFRELALTRGGRVRLCAVVAPSRRVVRTEYRSASAAGFEARDDLAEVTLDWVA
jgi:hypothetical protein